MPLSMRYGLTGTMPLASPSHSPGHKSTGTPMVPQDVYHPSHPPMCAMQQQPHPSILTASPTALPDNSDYPSVKAEPLSPKMKTVDLQQGRNEKRNNLRLKLSSIAPPILNRHASRPGQQILEMFTELAKSQMESCGIAPPILNQHTSRPSQRILGMLAKLVESRMESCERVTNTVTTPTVQSSPPPSSHHPCHSVATFAIQLLPSPSSHHPRCPVTTLAVQSHPHCPVAPSPSPSSGQHLAIWSTSMLFGCRLR